MIVDTDQQKNTGLLLPSLNSEPVFIRTSDLFAEHLPDAPLESISDTLSIIRADRKLILLEQQEDTVRLNFKQNLAALQNKFDLCVIDTPPALGIALASALFGADYVVAPTGLGLLDMSGIGDLMKTIKTMQNHNPKLKFIGILPSKVKTLSSIEMKNLEELRKKYGQFILNCQISNSIAVEHAAFEQKAIWHSSRKSNKVAKEIKTACEYILNKVF